MTASPSPSARPPRLLPALAALLCLLWLGACTAPKPRVDEPAPAAAGADADRLVAAGDHRAAAELLLAQAARSETPERESLHLAAAEALLTGQYWDDAERIIGALPPTGPPDYRTRLVIGQARLAIARNQARDALDRLRAIDDEVPPALAAEFHRVRADAYAAAGNHLESARERIWLDGLLDPAAQADNHRAIWQSLAQLPDTLLRSMRRAPPPDVFSGWLELVETARAASAAPAQRDIAIGLWRERYPNHPAARQFIAELLQVAAPPGVPAADIAVLLPLSGPLAEAGQAIRDGILAAYYHAPTRTARVRFHDTAGQADRAMALYGQAVVEGAQLVIGPLTKESVAALAGATDLPVPVLALNSLARGEPGHGRLYQFSLSPEDEAAQVVERAWHDGHRRALVIAPEGAWGDRLTQAFAERWRAQGGILLETQRFGDDERGYSDTVRELLDIDESERRHQSLGRFLGRQTEFEPRARQDADYLFLVANAGQARLIRPLLRFHRAGHLPVYTTSQINEGGFGAGADADLDGIRFCDMPWMLEGGEVGMLRSTVRRLWTDREQRYTRLYALGVDAFQLAPRLQTALPGVGGVLHKGVTGDLSLDAERRLYRTLRWAEFKGGVIRALPPVGVPPETAPMQPEELTDEPDDEITPQPGDGR